MIVAMLMGVAVIVVVLVWMGMRMVVVVPMIMVMGMSSIVGMVLCVRGGHGSLLPDPHRRRPSDAAVWSCYCWQV